MLSDRQFFLSCAPSLHKFEVIHPDPAPEIPEAIRAQARGDGKTECFRVTDIVHAMPAGLWDTNVVSTYEFTNITDGVFVRIKSPMSISMDTVWLVKHGEDGKLELTETLSISCSRLLMGLVKAECEGWVNIHAKMLSRLEDEIKAQA